MPGPQIQLACEHMSEHGEHQGETISARNTQPLLLLQVLDALCSAQKQQTTQTIQTGTHSGLMRCCRSWRPRRCVPTFLANPGWPLSDTGPEDPSPALGAAGVPEEALPRGHGQRGHCVCRAGIWRLFRASGEGGFGEMWDPGPYPQTIQAGGSGLGSVSGVCVSDTGAAVWTG